MKSKTVRLPLQPESHTLPESLHQLAVSLDKIGQLERSPAFGVRLSEELQLLDMHNPDIASSHQINVPAACSYFQTRLSRQLRGIHTAIRYDEKEDRFELQIFKKRPSRLMNLLGVEHTKYETLNSRSFQVDKARMLQLITDSNSALFDGFIEKQFTYSEYLQQASVQMIEILVKQVVKTRKSMSPAALEKRSNSKTDSTPVDRMQLCMSADPTPGSKNALKAYSLLQQYGAMAMSA